MSLIIVINGPEHLELFAPDLGKFAEFDYVFILASILKGKRNAQIYTEYLKFIYVSKMNSFSHHKSTSIHKIKSDIQTSDSYDSTIDFPSLLM